MNILSSSLLETGDEFSSFETAVEEFEEKSRQLIVNLADEDFAVWLFKDVKEKDVRTVKIDDRLVRNIQTGNIQNLDFSIMYKLNVGKFPKDIQTDIKNGSIPAALQYGRRLLFLDICCISRLLGRVNIPAKSLSDKNIVGYMALYDALARIDGPISFVVRGADGYWKAMNAGSSSTTFRAVVPIVKELEDVSGFELSEWEITQYHTQCVLEGPATENYIPVILAKFSDTGHGNEKFFLGVKSINADKFSNAAIIAELKKETFQKEYEKLKEAAAKNENSLRTVDGESVLRDKNILHAIGKKRAEVLKPFFEKGYESDIMKTVADISDLVGAINRSSDFELMTAAGRIFMTGIK